MELIITLILSTVFIISFFFILFVYGHFCFNILSNIKNENRIDNNYVIFPVIGFSILSILSNYLYFLINLNFQYIIIIFFFLFFFLFFANSTKIILFKSFLKLLKKIILILIFLICITLIKGEQFYIFRGNYWDNMTYISQATLIQDYSFKDILNFRSQNFQDHSYLHHGSNTILFRPLTAFFLAGFLFTNIFNFFYLSFLFKIFLLLLTFLSFYYFAKIAKFKNIYFISLGYIFSFWFLYIFEIDALSHLNAIAPFLICLTYLLKLQKNFIFNYKNDYFIFLISNIAFFFLYPEFFSIYVLVVIVYFLLNYNFLNIRRNFKKIIYLIIIFLIFTLPNYKTTYLFLINQIKIGTSENINFWGYFSAFFIGKDNAYLNEQNIIYIKNIFKNSNDSLYLLKELLNILFQNNYYLFFLNIIPSFFGLYFLTTSSFSSFIDYIFLALIFLLNIILIKTIFVNFLNIFKYKLQLFKLVKSFILIFLFFSIYLIFNRGYWPFTKLFSYFGPIIYIFIILNFNNHNQNKLTIRHWYIFLIMIFPIYKFSTDNSGIGKYDSFPSIINVYYKKNIDWSLNKSDMYGCGIASIDSTDPIINGYISIKLRYLGYKHFEYNNYKLNETNQNNCRINLIKNKFIINKNVY